MHDSTDKPNAEEGGQRDALLDSERKANDKQPRNVKEEAINDKFVEIKPGKNGDAPIQGLDP